MPARAAYRSFLAAAGNDPSYTAARAATRQLLARLDAGQAAGHGIAAEPALGAYLHAVTANLISAGVRLIPLGQTDGQRLLAGLEPVVAATAARALATPLDRVGGAAFRADLAGMLHETQYTRLFRS